MEVIGLVAAIPGLIEIAQKTISVIRAFIDQNSFVKQIKELLDQLELIETILREILTRLKSSAIHHSDFARLTTVTQSLKDELIGLGDLFQPLIASPGRKAKVLNRARVLIRGLEGKVKKYHERLDGAKSSLILVIVAQNEAIIEENLTTSRSNLRLKLNDVLLPSGYNFIPQNLEGTCEWIWSHPVFCEWKRDPASSTPVGHEHQIMCIYGPKGCGKSVLAASIVEKLKSQAKFAIGFSFWAGSHNQQKLLAFLRTFLWNMIQQIPDDSLDQISAPLLKSIPLTEKALEDIILITIKAIKSHVYCIIDGIDESVDDWARPDAGGLRLVRDLAKAHANLQIVLLGRDASMRPATSLTPLRIEVTEDLIRPDINRLILHHLDSSLNIRDPATRQLVQEALQESSRIMFLWVTFIFRELNRCQLPSEISRTLHQVPRDLDREYHRLFVRLQDRLGGTRNRPSLPMERAKCLLSWIIASPEPLTYEELRCAFAISQCPDNGYEQYMISKDGIMDTCGDFIRISDGRYHMAHASIAEFLTRPIELWQCEDENIDYFRIDVLQSQSLMCLKCTDYFQRIDLGYALTDASLATSHASLPIFSCALKFTLIYLTRTYSSEHREKVWEHLGAFMGTSQFCSLVEYGLFTLQNETATSSEQYVEIMKFISWAAIEESVDPLPFTQLLVKPIFQEELARRAEIFGPQNERFRTWKSIVDVVSPEDNNQRTVSGLYDVEGNNGLKDTEIVPGNHVDGPLQKVNVGAGRAAEHTAMLKIGDTITTKAPVLGALARIKPRLTSVIPELLPIPLLIFRALGERDLAREEQYWLSAVKRLAGADTFFEAYSVFELAKCRYSESETIEGLLNRCRRIATSLPSSLHVDVLLCSILKDLAWFLLDRDRFVEAQEIVSELQQRLSNGPTKGYVSTPLERKLSRSLFWDDWEAVLLAKIAKYHVWQASDVHYAKALSIVDSNMQLYQNPKPGRIRASILAHCIKAEALYEQWDKGRAETAPELACKSEVACRVVLRLAKFPNMHEYVDEQWGVLGILSYLLYGQRRYREAKELISLIRSNFRPTICTYEVVAVAATAVCLGDLDTGEVLLERASVGIQDQKESLIRSQPKEVASLIAVLSRFRPILRLWSVITLCWRKVRSKKISKASRERDFWYDDANIVEEFEPCFHEFWDIFYIRYISLRDDEGCAAFLNFVWEYTRRQELEAAAAVTRYILSCYSHMNVDDRPQWRLHCTGLSLYFAFRGEESLALYRSMLLWTEKCAPCEHQWRHYFNIGVSCFIIGCYHKDGKPLSVEALKLAVASYTRARDAGAPSIEIETILRRIANTRSALEDLGVATDSLELADIVQINPNIVSRSGILRHQSCPDLRARYTKEEESPRTAYNLWRKHSVKPARVE
ncbi:hypothetical protein F5X98DRAFT_333652 [Xylaria grammica]|nr:hypothetical protein F5X98DRAFT_333652 [Xylaria grammica]